MIIKTPTSENVEMGYIYGQNSYYRTGIASSIFMLNGNNDTK